MKTGMRLLSVVVLTMLMSSLSAQQAKGQRAQRTPEEIAKTQVEWMKTDLKLNEATQKKVYDVVLKYANQSKEEMQKLAAAGDKKAIRAKMTEIGAARDKELKVVLGDKDYELFKTKEAEKKEAEKPQGQGQKQGKKSGKN
ncbi:MAG: hypothetical protein NT144_09955 [Bacteroidia bacterium]|nr:hypothetical protein [Bacteroidia bacterium]